MLPMKRFSLSSTSIAVQLGVAARHADEHAGAAGLGAEDAGPRRRDDLVHRHLEPDAVEHEVGAGDRLAEEVEPGRVGGERRGCPRRRRPVDAFTVSVAPNRRATSSLSSSRSTAMIGSAPTTFAATIADRPTPPTPITATLWPRCTPAVCTTAPAPVITAHPMIDVTSVGTSSGSVTTNSSSAIVRSAQVNTFCETAVVPSGSASVAADVGRPAFGDARHPRDHHAVALGDVGDLARRRRARRRSTRVRGPQAAVESPCIWCSCEWHTPLANCCTTTWCGPGSGSCTSSMRSGPGPAGTTTTRAAVGTSRNVLTRAYRRLWSDAVEHAEDLPPTVERLLWLLELERLDRDLFRARSPRHRPNGRLFGGQVAAQALRAATLTVEVDHHPHSLHGYFLRPGLPKRPLILSVDRIRDGRSFTTRRVVASPGRRGDLRPRGVVPPGRAGGEHQLPIALDVPVPDDDDAEDRRALVRQQLAVRDARRCATPPADERGVFESTRRVWVRTNGPLPDERSLHACVLTYISRHGRGDGGAQGARPAVDRWAGWPQASITPCGSTGRSGPTDGCCWTCARCRTPSSRGLVLGTMHDQAGVHGVSMTQEALVREAQGVSCQPRAERRRRRGPLRPTTGCLRTEHRHQQRLAGTDHLGAGDPTTSRGRWRRSAVRACACGRGTRCRAPAWHRGTPAVGPRGSRADGRAHGGCPGGARAGRAARAVAGRSRHVPAHGLRASNACSS